MNCIADQKNDMRWLDIEHEEPASCPRSPTPDSYGDSAMPRLKHLERLKVFAARLKVSNFWRRKPSKKCGPFCTLIGNYAAV
jgi:hypothetical protein